MMHYINLRFTLNYIALDRPCMLRMVQGTNGLHWVGIYTAAVEHGQKRSLLIFAERIHIGRCIYRPINAKIDKKTR